MKLSISNIAWDKQQDEQVYRLMCRYGFSGLEIAPTRVFGDAPYDMCQEAVLWSTAIKKDYSFSISSMQSIWYGRTEKLFGSEEEKRVLLAYTKKAIRFAEAIGCRNLVFGCPKNRCISDDSDMGTAIDFFREIGEYARKHDTVVGMEANPRIYGTNFINDTMSALELIKEVDSDGFLLNLDIGTMIENREPVNILCDQVGYINHVHISEPFLKRIERSQMHCHIKTVLQNEGYGGFMSVEMGKVEEYADIVQVIRYVSEMFLDK